MSTAGDLYENPVTGERCVVIVGDDDTDGERLLVELTISPGGQVVGEHVHSYITEAFEVLDGTVHFSINGAVSAVQPGTRVEVPVGTVHDWWNAGDASARVLVEVAPVGRFGEMITTLFGLARDGKTNAKGVPGLLQLSLFASEFRREAEFTSPPPLVQKALFTLLRPIARARGLKAHYPEYEEPHGKVPVPGDLAQHVVATSDSP